MFGLFKKSAKKDSNCCSIKIEEVKEQCCASEEKQESHSNKKAEDR